MVERRDKRCNGRMPTGEKPFVLLRIDYKLSHIWIKKLAHASNLGLMHRISAEIAFLSLEPIVVPANPNHVILLCWRENVLQLYNHRIVKFSRRTVNYNLAKLSWIFSFFILNSFISEKIGTSSFSFETKRFKAFDFHFRIILLNYSIIIHSGSQTMSHDSLWVNQYCRRFWYTFLSIRMSNSCVHRHSIVKRKHFVHSRIRVRARININA